MFFPRIHCPQGLLCLNPISLSNFSFSFLKLSPYQKKKERKRKAAYLEIIFFSGVNTLGEGGWVIQGTYSIPMVTLSQTPWLNQPQYGSREAMQDLEKNQRSCDVDFLNQHRRCHCRSRSARGKHKLTFYRLRSAHSG